MSGVRPGDDVLVSSLTFAASANAVVHCGANPVFIDSERTSWNMDPALLAEALTAAGDRGRLPTAAVVVDLYGQCADYDAIATLCDDRGVALVEDAAEALGATHGERAAGTLGDIGVFSFNGNKVATTSGGGMVVTPDAGGRRPRPPPGDAGQGAGAPLRARRGRVQLPPEQPARRDRPGPARPPAAR